MQDRMMDEMAEDAEAIRKALDEHAAGRHDRWEMSVDPAHVARRRARNKAAKQSRKRNR